MVAARQKQAELDREIEKVKKEYEERQRKRKEKKKEKEGKKDEEKGKEEKAKKDEEEDQKDEKEKEEKVVSDCSLTSPATLMEISRSRHCRSRNPRPKKKVPESTLCRSKSLSQGTA